MKGIIHQKIYFDYTAGRGPYDEEYKDEITDFPQIRNQKEQKRISNDIQSNTNNTNNRATFGNIPENHPHKLYHINCNQFQEKRRFSYSKGQNRWRNYDNNETLSENNFHYSNFNSSDIENKPQKTANSTAINWSPTPIGMKKQ